MLLSLNSASAGLLWLFRRVGRLLNPILNPTFESRIRFAVRSQASIGALAILRMTASQINATLKIKNLAFTTERFRRLQALQFSMAPLIEAKWSQGTDPIPTLYRRSAR